MKLKKFILLQIHGLAPNLTQKIKSFLNPNFLRGIKSFLKDYFLYKKLNKIEQSPFKLKFSEIQPYYFDKYDEAGGMVRHYFHQDLWAAKKIYKSKVKKHYDIGSRFDGFIAHCLVFCKVIMIDIRPMNLKISGLEFIQVDATRMGNIKSGSMSSISSLHAVEHFGLGRYGDKVDPWGYKKAIDEIKRVTKKGGDIYFSVPIGTQRLEFNAQRVFNPMYILDLFKGCLLVEFSVVDDNNNLLENVRPAKFVKSTFSCGLYHFRKT